MGSYVWNISLEICDQENWIVSSFVRANVGSDCTGIRNYMIVVSRHETQRWVLISDNCYCLVEHCMRSDAGNNAPSSRRNLFVQWNTWRHSVWSPGSFFLKSSCMYINLLHVTAGLHCWNLLQVASLLSLQWSC